MRHKHWHSYLRLCLFVILVAAAVVIYKRADVAHQLSLSGIRHLRAEVRAAGWKGAALYTGVYILFVTFGLPNLPFQIGAGAIYGTGLAYLLMYIGVNIGAVTAFGVARLLGRQALEEWFSSKLLRVNEQLNDKGFRFLLFLRLIPLMPFNAINYSSGISRLKLRDYIAANIIGMIPLTFVHVAIGSAAGQLDLTNPHSWLDLRILLPLCGSLAILVTAFIVRRL